MVPDPTLSIEEGAIAAWPGAWAGKNFHHIRLKLGYDLVIFLPQLPKVLGLHLAFSSPSSFCLFYIWF